MNTWNLRVLKDEVESSQSEDVSQIFKQIIESVVTRQRICLFHREGFQIEYSKLLNSDATNEQVLAAFLGDSDERQCNRRYMHVACTSHAVGYMQSAHAIIDTMSHVIYYALNLGGVPSTTLRATQINMGNVKRKLESQTDCTELLDSLNAWMRIDGYQYLVDFSNLSKHRALVDTILSGDLSEDAERIHGLKFSDFDKDGRSYSEIFIDEWINQFHNDFIPMILSVGNQLNEVVKARTEAVV